MKKAVFFIALFVGPWFISHNAVANDLTIDTLMFDVSGAHYKTSNPYGNEGYFTEFASGHLRNGGYHVDLMGNKPSYEHDNSQFKVNAQMPESHGLDGISKATSFPETATMFLFGVGLVLFAESRRNLKRRNLRKRKKSSPHFFMVKEHYSAIKTPSIRGSGY